jgi:hypothetical protein
MNDPDNDDDSTGKGSRAADRERPSEVQSPDGSSPKKVYVKLGEGDDAEEIARQLIQELFPRD